MATPLPAEAPEQWFRQIVEDAPNAILLVTESGEIALLNGQAEMLFGYARGELIGRPVEILIPQRFRGHHPGHRADFLASHSERPMGAGRDLFALRKDGTEVPVEIGLKPIRAEEGLFVLTSIIDISERQRADQELRESEERYRSLVELSPEAICIMSDQRLVYVNDAFVKLLGATSAKELVGTPVLDIVHPEEWDSAKERMRLLLEEGRPVPLQERRLLRLDGRVIETETAASPLTYLGKPAAQVILRDVSPRKFTQRRQTAELALARILAEAAGVAEAAPRVLREIGLAMGWPLAELWTVDQAAGVLRCTNVWHDYGVPGAQFAQSIAKMTLSKGEGLPGRTWVGTTPLLIRNIAAERDLRESPEARLGLRAALSVPVMAHRRVRGVVQFFSREVDGSSEPLLGMISLIGAQLGQFLERREAEAALRDSEERFRQLAEHMHEVFWMTSADFSRMIYVSPSYSAIWGRSPESLYAEPSSWAQAVHPEDRARVVETAASIAEKGEYRQEYRIVRPDGSARWILDRAAAIRDPSGKVYRVAGIAEDVTERKQLEEQFRQAQKMEAVGQLAGGIAHDFNNLLTAIMGYSEIVESQLEKTNPLVEDVREVIRSSERAAGLTRQLLAFSRKQMLQPAVLSLNELIQDLDKMLRRLIGEDIALTLALDPSLGAIKADRGQIEQVIMNLAVNARDAMPRGGKLTIASCPAAAEEPLGPFARLPAGSYLRLTISDTGCGMDSGVQARLFEPFFTTKGPGRGTGLGLSTVQGIVAQSDGHIALASEPGKGTSFKIYFPLVAESPSAARPKKAEPGQLRGTETILLAEDDEALRFLAARVLKSGGYSVIASKGRDALALTRKRKGPLDLLLTDIVMPEISGRELAETLQGLRPGLKVLFMSGYTDDAIVRHGVSSREVAFLEKPFTPDGLLRKVRQTLDSR